MLAAYEGRDTGAVPVAPEFWCYIPARLLGVPMYEFHGFLIEPRLAD